MTAESGKTFPELNDCRISRLTCSVTPSVFKQTVENLRRRLERILENKKRNSTKFCLGFIPRERNRAIQRFCCWRKQHDIYCLFVCTKLTVRITSLRRICHLYVSQVILATVNQKFLENYKREGCSSCHLSLKVLLQIRWVIHFANKNFSIPLTQETFTIFCAQCWHVVDYEPTHFIQLFRDNQVW